MKEARNLATQGEDVEAFSVIAGKYYKKAKFNAGTKQGMIIRFIKSDENFLLCLS